jgi:hypothetical protein
MEAVGPDNFGFPDRTVAGMDSFPDLQRHIAANFRIVFDLPSTALFIDKEAFESCCVELDARAWNPSGDWRIGRQTGEHDPFRNYQYILGAHSDSDGPGGLQVIRSSPIDRGSVRGLLVPVRVSVPAPGNAVQLVEETGAGTEIVAACPQSTLDGPSWHVCTLRAPAGDAKLSLQLVDAGGHPHQWGVTIGTPTFVRR